MLSDIEIAQQNKMEKIQVIADKCGLTPDDIEQYGHYKAKISFDAIRRLESKPDGKLVLVHLQFSIVALVLLPILFPF